MPGVVVLGGDVHAHYVADLKRDFDERRAPVVGHRVLRHVDREPRRCAGAHRPKRCAHNPHIRYGRSDRRGYVPCRLDAQALQAQLMAVDDPAQPDSALQSMARFVVEAEQPGARAGLSTSRDR